jgi:hypothetical protein
MLFLVLQAQSLIAVFSAMVNQTTFADGDVLPDKLFEELQRVSERGYLHSPCLRATGREQCHDWTGNNIDAHDAKWVSLLQRKLSNFDP